MLFKSRIKWFALVGFVLSVASILLHFLLAKYSNGDLVHYHAKTGFTVEFVSKVGQKNIQYRKLWGKVSPLENLQPYANPRSSYLVPSEHNNGFIYAKVFGGFEMIRSSICDLVTISRLLNATLVIPEIQESTQTKGISSMFKSFSYIYNEEQFIAALSNDVTVVKSLPKSLKEARKRKSIPTFSPKISASPTFYIREVLPKLKVVKVVGLIITDGGCLQSILPATMDEYQRLRCRVAFHALHFRPEIMELGRKMVERLRTWGQPYMAFHPGLVRNTLAYHGCAELFQDVHTELVQHQRAKMIKNGIIHEELSVDSHAKKKNGSCPLMPEEVGILLRAIGYLPNAIIYVSGAETFGGQRLLIPLRAMYPNLVDRTSLCTKKELSDLLGYETPILSDITSSPAKIQEEHTVEWDKAGPRPRPLPPPPARPVYWHEKEGWYGWVAETDTEPDPSPKDLRMQAHRLLWNALDYIVSFEADAFFPGFNNDGSGWPDFSSLVMGHRLYERASVRTYRPDRKYLVKMLDDIREHLYHPKRNWTSLVREHLNKSIGVDGLKRESQRVKPFSFLSHPLPECSCRIVESSAEKKDEFMFEGEDKCPEWMQQSLASVSSNEQKPEDGGDEGELNEDDTDLDHPESEHGNSKFDASRSLLDQDEMDSDD